VVRDRSSGTVALGEIKPANGGLKIETSQARGPKETRRAENSKPMNGGIEGGGDLGWIRVVSSPAACPSVGYWEEQYMLEVGRVTLQSRNRYESFSSRESRGSTESKLVHQEKLQPNLQYCVPIGRTAAVRLMQAKAGSDSDSLENASAAAMSSCHWP
jgi:hypothetical protein